jgi:hypothetical protein
MARVEAKLAEMGIDLPEPVKAPPGMRLPFSWVRTRGNRAYVSGHAALNPDGTPAGPFGKGEAEYPHRRKATRRRVWRRWRTPRQPGARAGRPGSGERMADGHGHGHRGTRFRRDAERDQRHLRSDPGTLRFRSGAHARTAPGMATLPVNTPVIILA